jgi:hypothetical protein
VLLIDSFLHRITHEEPLKIWLVKILLIAMLVPIQHYMEKGMIRFIESRKKKMGGKFSLKKWWGRHKKPITPATIESIEEDSAVL